jgi:hypothetical protein
MSVTEDLYSFENIQRQYRICRSNKRNTLNALAFEVNAEANVLALQAELRAHRYRPGTSICFISKGAKPREVFAADFRDRVVVPEGRLKQWRSDAGMLCAFIARDLDVRATGEGTPDGRLRQIGVVKGVKRSQMLCLSVAGGSDLVAGDGVLPLSAAVAFRDGKFALDGEMVRQLVDAARTADPRYTPTVVRREARKLETQGMYATWRAEYRRLKQERPNMSDTACARHIENRGLAFGRSRETVRKRMK